MGAKRAREKNGEAKMREPVKRGRSGRSRRKEGGGGSVTLRRVRKGRGPPEECFLSASQP